MKKALLYSLIVSAVTFAINVGAAVSEKKTVKNHKDIAAKIAFINGCKKEEIEFICIQKNYNGKYCMDYGVKACGDKFIFTRVAQSWLVTHSEKLNIIDSTSKLSHSINENTQISNIHSANAANQANIQASQQASMQAAQQASMAASQAAMAASQAAMAAVPPPQ